MVLEARNGDLVHQTGHGELEKIFVLTLPTDQFFGALSGKTLALALVTPWVTTEVTKATFKNKYMSSERASIVMDVRSLRHVVGLVPIGNRWGIIDRAPGTAARSFTESASWLDSLEDVEGEMGEGEMNEAL